MDISLFIILLALVLALIVGVGWIRTSGGRRS
jgi:hypothetical protein